MFTKQHYEALARLLACSNDLDDFTGILCHFLKQDNECFNEQKFQKYIGVVRQQLREHGHVRGV